MAGEDAYIASVDLWAGNYAPLHWAFCLGQTLPTSEHQALFSLIGCEFGGDCRSTYALPDMRGRVPIGVGTRPGGDSYQLGWRGGNEVITLTLAQMPQHNHAAAFTPGTPNLSGTLAMPVKTGIGTGSSDPTNKYFGSAGSTNLYYTDHTSGATMAPVSVPVTGSAPGTVAVADNGASHPIDIRQPYTALNFIICLEGIYPPRST
jgi:microcystin-dependent protein